MKVIKKQKVKTVVLIFLVLLFLGSKQETLAEEDYLIVRIAYADYPILGFFEEDTYNFTFFSIWMTIQTENPTSNNITVTYACWPYPFPYLRTNLQDKSLELRLAFVVKWVEGAHVIPPGVEADRYSFGMIAFNYPEAQETLPIGEYIIWFDYTNSSSVPVPVITQKLVINVTESNVTYYFEYGDRTEVYSLEQPTEIPSEIPTNSTTLNWTPYLIAVNVIHLYYRLRKRGKLINLKQRKK